MGSACQDCQWFRPFRPLSQNVLRDLGSGEPQVVEQLLKIMQDERQKQDAEMKLKVELLRLAESQLVNNPDEGVRVELQKWITRPTMTDHCGLREDEGVYFLHELKTLGGECEDFKPHDRARRSCDTCRHRCAGGGEARDARQYAELERLALNSAALEQGNGMNLIEEYQRFVETTKTLEAAQACYSGKIALKQPDYLPTCGLPSVAKFTPCAVRNQYDECRDWDKAAAAAAPPAMSEAEALDVLRSRPAPSTPANRG